MRGCRWSSAIAFAALLLICACGCASECNFTQAQLQAESLAILRKDYPGQEFGAGESPDMIRMGEVELGLDNLYARLCIEPKEPLDQPARAVEIRTHFAAMMKLIRQQENRQPLAWAEARKLVLPQLQTEEYFRSLANGKEVFVTRSFVPGVVLAAVIDQPNGYQYIRKEELERWHVTREALFAEGLRNLTEKAMDSGLQGANGAEKFLSSEEGDGYDAARILVPWVREQAAKLLGEPFFAAIPNRDFLIMWSTANSAEFHKLARGNVEQALKERPYALSSRVLRVWADGRIEVE